MADTIYENSPKATLRIRHTKEVWTNLYELGVPRTTVALNMHTLSAHIACTKPWNMRETPDHYVVVPPAITVSFEPCNVKSSGYDVRADCGSTATIEKGKKNGQVKYTSTRQSPNVLYIVRGNSFQVAIQTNAQRLYPPDFFTHMRSL